MSTPRKPLVLMILDGWGVAECDAGNAVCKASTPFLDSLKANYPSTTIDGSGMSVGLPDGQMGNSEVGHLNLGAGRIVYQDLTKITKSIADGDLFENQILVEAINKAKASGGTLHLMGLLSDGGVHSHNTHLYALVQMAKQHGLDRVAIHCFMDGRDTPPQSGKSYLEELEAELVRIGIGSIASVIGRFYAMDRDNRWDRVERAYAAMVTGSSSNIANSAIDAIDAAYAAGQTDEFVEPTVIDKDGRSSTLQDGDSVIFFNFRADRAREITRAITQPDFEGFDRSSVPQLASYVCLTPYDATFPLPVAYPKVELINILGGILAKNGKRQLRIAETEKYAHVTFFFNGGVEKPFEGEERMLIPSPKEVATYDQKPEMSAPAVTEAVVAAINSGTYDVIVLNFANPDMVGHTGILSATIEAMEVVDACVDSVVKAVLAAGGALLITADHGNSEKMIAESGGPHTAHTSNPVPLILVDSEQTDVSLREGGVLADIAPTLLTMLNIPLPVEMTGTNLIV